MRDIFMSAHGVPPDRIKVLHHGLDVESWAESAREESGIRKEYEIEKKVVFLAAGRLFWVKGFEMLIRTFAGVSKKREDVVLLIAGEGADRQRLAELIKRLNVCDKVKLIGKRSDIASVMNDSDVLVHPSLAESFGLIYTEAFALGKPVIATRRGIAEELVLDGKSGYLIEIVSDDDLAEAFRKMLEREKDWNAMGRIGKQAVERFAVQQTQAEYDRFILSLVH
jgi:glycosyltransferase involved in cell wall biosynthesis